MKLQKDGLKEKKKTAGNGLCYTMHCRNPIEVLQEQMRCTTWLDVFPSSTSGPYISHPMNILIRTGAVPLLKVIWQGHIDNGVVWWTTEVDGKQSAIGLLQILSDESQTKLQSDAFDFYPLHRTLLNFSKVKWREHFSKWRTVAACLPVSFDRSGTAEKFCTGTYEVRPTAKFGRVDSLSARHHNVEHVLLKISRVTMQRVFNSSSDKLLFRLHMLLTSYLADLPEADDMLGVERSHLTLCPCHRCLLSREEMSYTSTHSKRDKLKTPSEFWANQTLAETPLSNILREKQSLQSNQCFQSLRWL